MKRMNEHAKTLKSRSQKLKQAENDMANAGKRQEQRRAERKIARETRAKE